ncbi:hypothetical protein [Burkholderia cepacia]|uniref:hypothetical protein n=1 Tax=Burkholderia cepacia TaxID=292 RepID=UPI002FE24423
MATNEFLVFGGGSSPNVIDQATYAALAARLSGFQSGTALSAQLNKVWRQSSIMAAVLAQFTANFSGQNSVDDGTIATLLANLQAAINAAGITAPQFDNTAKLATTAFVQRALGNFNGFVQYSAAATMANSTIGAYVQTVTNAFTLTVPSPVAVPGGLIAFWNNNSNPVTLSTLVGKFYGGLGTATSTYVMQPQECIVIATDGINWCVNESTLRGNTAAQFDNSTMLATTAFTQRALGNYRSARGYVGNATLSATDIGAMITWDGNGTLTLPDATAFPGGAAIRVFKYAGPIASVLAANKPGQMNVPTSGADTYTFAVGVYGFFELINESSMKWDVAGELFNQYGTTAAAGDNSTRLSTTAWYWNQIAAGVSSAGKVNGVNAPNLLFNGSGEFGAIGWVMAPGPAFSQQVDQTGGIGSFFANASPMSNASGYIGSPLVQIGQNTSVTESIDVANFATAGTLVLTLAAYNAAGTFISNVASLTVANGTPLQRYSLTGTTPAGTSNVQAYWTYTGISASAFGIAIRRIKIEQGSAPSLYSQEASIATVGGGMPVVGTARNVAMSVATASATATLTADEIIVGSSLGGVTYKLDNFNQTINLATTGAGGTDTGSAPVSGFVALYAIYNPTTKARALLARNATSAVQPNVYGGGNMPAGYTASALVSVWQTTSGGLLNVGSQFDRVISTPGFTVLSTTTQAGSYTSFSISGGVPPNAKTARGYQSITGNTASAGLSSSIAGSASGIGAAGQAATMPTSSASVTTPFPHIPLVTPQTLYYLAAASSGTLTFVVGVYEYTF